MIQSLTTDLYRPLWTDLPGSEPRSEAPLLGLRLPLLNQPLAAASANDIAGDDEDEQQQVLAG